MAQVSKATGANLKGKKGQLAENNPEHGPHHPLTNPQTNMETHIAPF